MFRPSQLSGTLVRGGYSAIRPASRSAWLVGLTSLALVALTSRIPDLLLSPGAPVVDTGEVTLRSTLVTAPIYLLFVILGLSQPNSLLRLVRHCWPLMLLLGLAVASSTWSSDPGVTLRKSLSFSASAMVGVFMVARVGPIAALRALIWFLAICVLISALLAVLAPSFAVHQGGLLEPPEFSGLWRGVFANKNQLGQIAALALALITLSGRGVFRSEAAKWAIAGAALGCLAMSQSGGGIATTFILFLSYAYLRFLRTLGQGAQKLAIFSAILMFVPVVLAAEYLAGTALGLLGKDPTLTGRTLLWEIVSAFAVRDVWFGAGYWTGFQGIRPHLLAALGWNPPNAHNTFLDVVIALGVLGLAAFMLMLAHFGRSSISIASAQRTEAASLKQAPYFLFVFAVVLSAAESSMITERHAVAVAVFLGYAAAQALFTAPETLGAENAPLPQPPNHC